MRRRILIGLERAARWGFDADSEACNLFVSLMFAYAPNFDEQPSIRLALLRSRDFGDRWKHIFEQTSDADWEEAEEETDLGAWNAASEGPDGQ